MTIELTTSEHTRGRLHLLRAAFGLAATRFEDGSVLGFGVRAGDSLLALSEMVAASGRDYDLIGFDSWHGLPPETPGVYCPARHIPGTFAVERATVERRMRTAPRPARLIDGWFDDSLTDELKAAIRRPVVLVNLDCDLHGSTLTVLQWLDGLIAPGTLLYFDDWNDAEPDAGQARAFVDWHGASLWRCAQVAVADHGRRIMEITA